MSGLTSSFNQLPQLFYGVTNGGANAVPASSPANVGTPSPQAPPTVVNTPVGLKAAGQLNTGTEELGSASQTLVS